MSCSASPELPEPPAPSSMRHPLLLFKHSDSPRTYKWGAQNLYQLWIESCDTYRNERAGLNLLGPKACHLDLQLPHSSENSVLKTYQNSVCSANTTMRKKLLMFFRCAFHRGLSQAGGCLWAHRGRSRGRKQRESSHIP